MRVIAFTADPSLSVALSMMGDLEVVVAHTQDEAVALAADAGVIVVGLGGTDEGLATVESIFNQGVTIPFVVVGDEAPPAGARAPVVTRPFSLDDIQHAVDLAMANGGASQAGQARPNPPEPAAPAPPREPLVVRPDPTPVPADESFSIEEIDLPEPDAPRPEPNAPIGEPEPPIEPEVPARTLRIVEQEPVARAPEPDAGAPPPPLPAEAGVGPKAQETAYAAEPRIAQPQKKRFGRKASSAPGPDTDSPIDRRLRAGAVAAHDLEELLTELPMLADLATMADALLSEIVQMFQPETASIYMRGRDGFRVAASHGLSKVEEGLVVPETHALFSELIKTPEAVLIAPVDLARGLVAGIGGAHTQAMLAAPVSVEGRCVAMIVTGRDDFSDFDLQVIDDLAREAGPGLAVARLLDRLRAR